MLRLASCSNLKLSFKGDKPFGYELVRGGVFGAVFFL
jgi:hypothetical protein